MDKLGSLLILAGVLLIIYAIIGTFVGSAYVFAYIRPVRPSTVITLANSLLILGVITKIGKK